MIAFYKILSIPRKKQSASNELLLTEGPHGIEFSLNAVMPKAFFDHSRSEHTFQTNALYISLDSLIFRWRRDSGENLFQKEGSPSQLRKTLTLSKKHSRMLWLSRIDGGDLGEPNCLRVTLASQKGDPASRVPHPAEPTFCFSWKQFAKFCKEMLEKLVSPT